MSGSRFYEVEGYCTNCDYTGPIQILKGDTIPIRGNLSFFGGSIGRGLPVRCPTCGCFTCYGKK